MDGDCGVSPLCNSKPSSIQDEIEDEDLFVIPNPIEQGSDIKIRMDNVSNVEIRLFDEMGIMVHRNVKAKLI